MPISINEAVKAGITRLRLDRWANPADHIELTILKERPDGTGANQLGPWCNMWAYPYVDEPHKFCVVGPAGLGDFDLPLWTIYPIEPPR